MTKLEKLIEQIRRRPPEAEFADVRALLEAFGWALSRQSGSHVSFTKAGEGTQIIPKKGGSKVKRVYLQQICDRLGLD